MTRVGRQSSTLMNFMVRSKGLAARSHLILHGRRLIASSFREGREITSHKLALAYIFFLVQSRLLRKLSGLLNKTITHLRTNQHIIWR